MVWPIPFLINTFTALKGSQFNFYLYGYLNYLAKDGKYRNAVQYKDIFSVHTAQKFG